MNAEQTRLQENNAPENAWHFWGPYLADRAWGTVREDYSANGDAWNYLGRLADRVSSADAISTKFRWHIQPPDVITVITYEHGHLKDFADWQFTGHSPASSDAAQISHQRHCDR